MKLIRKLGTRLSKNGKTKISWGLFIGPGCGEEVERQLSSGLRNKSCGCQQRTQFMLC